MENTNSKIAIPAVLIAAAFITMIASNAFAFTSNNDTSFEERRANHETVREAINTGDYETFKEFAPEHMQEKIDENNFVKMTEAHNLREAGDYEAARAIMNDLGIHPKRNKRGHMNGCDLQDGSGRADKMNQDNRKQRRQHQ